MPYLNKKEAGIKCRIYLKEATFQVVFFLIFGDPPSMYIGCSIFTTQCFALLPAGGSNTTQNTTQKQTVLLLRFMDHDPKMLLTFHKDQISSFDNTKAFVEENVNWPSSIACNQGDMLHHHEQKSG